MALRISSHFLQYYVLWTSLGEEEYTKIYVDKIIPSSRSCPTQFYRRNSRSIKNSKLPATSNRVWDFTEACDFCDSWFQQIYDHYIKKIGKNTLKGHSKMKCFHFLACSSSAHFHPVVLAGYSLSSPFVSRNKNRFSFYW